jgi:DNA-binding SARP family transcriptional activator
MTHLSIDLFGSPHILVDGQVAEVPRRKSRAVAFYLAAHTGEVPRARLLAIFWPDHDKSAAQQILRTTLHGLRRVLGESLFSSDTALAVRDADIDAQMLSSVLAEPQPAEAMLAHALDRYRGEFLADFELPENPEFDDWVMAERERYRRMAIRGLATLAQLRAARGDQHAALEALARALVIDPLQEALQREAMQIEYQIGERAAAIRRYEQLSRRLDDELGVPPLPETRLLYDQIITDSYEPAVAVATVIKAEQLLPIPRQEGMADLPFVGRDQELALLRSWVGSAKLILVEGEPGIGKTNLAEQFVRQSGAVGLIGAARELEQSIPYHPLVEALRSLISRPEGLVLDRLDLAPVWRAEIGRLLPEVDAERLLTSSADESRVWEAVSQLLQALARLRPIILFLDDLQWADMATLGLLGYLARRSAAAPLTLLAAARPAEPRTPLAALLQALTREGRLVRLPLQRLGPDAVLNLAKRISPNHPQLLTEWLIQSGEGNPYMMVELVRYARERGLFGPNGTLVPGALDRPMVPQTVESLIQSRLIRLSEPARLLLDLGVAAGREFSFEVVAQASALSEAAVLDALDELRAARLLETLSDGDFRFDHSLTMEVAYREVGEPRHRRLHRRLAEALEDLHRTPEQIELVVAALAFHYSEAGAPERAAPYALRAARQAVRVAAWQDAIALYRQALAIAEPRQRLEAMLEYADALVHVGDTHSTEIFQQAIAMARTLGDLAMIDRARLALGWALIQQARYSEIIALVQQIREQGHPGSSMQAELLWGIALSIEGADLCSAAEHLMQAERLNDPQSNPAMHAHIIFELGNLRAQQGDLQQAVQYYRDALAYTEQAPAGLNEKLPSALQQRVLAYNNLGYHLLLLGDPQAEEYAMAGWRLSQEIGLLGMQPYLQSTLGEIALARGDLDQAEAHFLEGLALAERINIPERIAGMNANLGLVAQRRGQTALAVHRLTSALNRADALGLPHLATQIRIWLAPLLPGEAARATLAEARAIAETGGRARLLAEIERVQATL